MSAVSELVDSYRRELELPWRSNISGAERVWLIGYPPPLERRIRAALGEFEVATLQANKTWAPLDLTDSFGQWLSNHKYRSALLHEPESLTTAILGDYEASVVAKVQAALDGPGLGADSVVALVGVGSLFPFIRVSRVIAAVERSIRGRLAVFFPGSLDPMTGNCRLLDARDGFNYRAQMILPSKDTP